MLYNLLAAAGRSTLCSQIPIKQAEADLLKAQIHQNKWLRHHYTAIYNPVMGLWLGAIQYSLQPASLYYEELVPLDWNSGKNTQLKDKEEAVSCHNSKWQCMTRLTTISNGLHTATVYTIHQFPPPLWKLNDFSQLLLCEINLQERKRCSQGIKGANALYYKSKLIGAPSKTRGFLTTNQSKERTEEWGGAGN